MEKRIYEEPQNEIIYIDSADIITTSDENVDLPWIPVL